MRKTILIAILATLVTCTSKPQKLPPGKDETIYDKPDSYEQVDTLHGHILDTTVYSSILNESRRISIYSPPGLEPEKSYGLLLVTDDIGNLLPYFIEPLIKSKTIEPIFIVGVYNRSEQPIDSIFGETVFDFRNMEMMKEETVFSFVPEEQSQTTKKKFPRYLTEEVSAYVEDSILHDILEHRYDRFSSFINLEILPFLTAKYPISNELKQRTIGGISSGGAFVFSYTCDFPETFGNAIVMSPAGPGDRYDFSGSDYTYYIVAGNNEVFHKESIKHLNDFDSLHINYYHRTYDAGHEAWMWLDFYLAAVKTIYAVR